MDNYRLEFTLSTYNVPLELIKNSLSEFGENLEVCACGGNNANRIDFKVHINSEEPTVIFDICSQFGRIKSVRVDDAGDSYKKPK